MDYSEKWGKTVEEAVELALKNLETTRDNVDVEVLEEPTKGFLSLGAKPAKVRVSLKSAAGANTEEKATKTEGGFGVPGETTREDLAAGAQIPDYGTLDLRSTHKAETQATATEPRRERSQGKRGGKGKGGRKEKDYKELTLTEGSVSVIANKPEGLVPIEEHPVLDFLKETTEKMGLELTMTAEGNEENLYVELAGKDAGAIIGKRGQTLDAIQYLASLVANKAHGKYVRVVLDAENYRTKREKTLQQLAIRLGNKALRTGRPVKLEPMNPYERMVIHATLHGFDEITTKSEGEEPYRKVIIEKK